MSDCPLQGRPAHLAAAHRRRYAFIELTGECNLVHLHNYLDDYPRRLPDKTWD